MKNYRAIINKIMPGTIHSLAILLACGIMACNRQAPVEAFSRSVSFDSGWKFMKDSLINAEDPGFDDSDWRILDVPHDWSIEDLPGQNGIDIIGPFNKSAVDKMSTGYTVGGVGWYRKSFSMNEEDRDKIIYLQFDGVYMNSDVWINGKHLGFHPYGYTPFIYDITRYLNPPGENNLVAVRVRNEGLNSRWYSGSGINRHVWLVAVNPVHVDISGGVFITTPEVSEKSASVSVVSALVNSGTNDENLVVRTEIFDPSGKMTAKATSECRLLSGSTLEMTQNLIVLNPSLWSVDTPALYLARVSVEKDGEALDITMTDFGIRSISIDVENGLRINGEPLDLIGGCYHHDNGPLGAAAIDRAEERKIEKLKEYGFNAIRTSHNPPSPALLDACDRLGMIVINEIFDMWEAPKKARDYHLYFREWWKKDVEAWIKRDRNHPSVIMWSIGNEIREAADTSGYRIARNLVGEVKRLDPTRAVTEAMLGLGQGRAPGRTRWDDFETHLELLDVVGYNYAFSRYESDHDKYPERIMIGLETNAPFALENYELVKKLPYVIGYFVWTATDNIGEAGVGLAQLRDIEESGSSGQPDVGTARQRPGGEDAFAPPADMPGMPGTQTGPMAGGQIPSSPGGIQGAAVTGQPAGASPVVGFFRQDTWPVYINYQGDIDLVGNRKVPSFYQYVVWGKSKVEMFVHRPIPEGKREVTSRWGFPDELKSWNWEGREGEKLKVNVYTRCPEVKLELNGKLVGEQNVDQSSSITAAFEVPYEPGSLVARCYDNGVEVASETIKTTGKPASLRLTADRSRIRASKDDLSYVIVEVLDNDGNIVTDADNVEVRFEIEGAGKIAAVGNGAPGDMSSFQQPLRKTWQGVCLAIVQPAGRPGKITLRASADDIRGDKIVINSR